MSSCPEPNRRQTATAEREIRTGGEVVGGRRVLRGLDGGGGVLGLVVVEEVLVVVGQEGGRVELLGHLVELGVLPGPVVAEPGGGGDEVPPLRREVLHLQQRRRDEERRVRVQRRRGDRHGAHASSSPDLSYSGTNQIQNQITASARRKPPGRNQEQADRNRRQSPNRKGGKRNPRDFRIGGPQPPGKRKTADLERQRERSRTDGDLGANEHDARLQIEGMVRPRRSPFGSWMDGSVLGNGREGGALERGGGLAG